MPDRDDSGAWLPFEEFLASGAGDRVGGRAPGADAPGSAGRRSGALGPGTSGPDARERVDLHHDLPYSGA